MFEYKRAKTILCLNTEYVILWAKEFGTIRKEVGALWCPYG